MINGFVLEALEVRLSCEGELACSGILTVVETINETLIKSASNGHLAEVAKWRGLDMCIECCYRQGDNPPSSKTLKLGVTAVIGAVWIDCDRDMTIVADLVDRLR